MYILIQPHPIHIPYSVALEPAAHLRMIYPVADVVEAGLPVVVIAAVKDGVVVGRGGAGVGPVVIVDRHLAVRIIDVPLHGVAAGVEERRHVHVRVRGVVERIVDCTVGVGVMEADDGRIDVPQVPDELFERVDRVAALVDLQHLPLGIVVGVEAGFTCNVRFDAAFLAVVFVGDDEGVLAGVEVARGVVVLVDLDEAVPGVVDVEVGLGGRGLGARFRGEDEVAGGVVGGVESVES